MICEAARNAPIPTTTPRTNMQRIFAWAVRIHPMPFTYEDACEWFHCMEPVSVRRAMDKLKVANKIRFVHGSKRDYELVPEATAPDDERGRPPKMTFVEAEH